MIDPGWKLTSEARQLLDLEKAIPPLPAAVRARAVARARTSTAASPLLSADVSAPPRAFRFAFAGAMGVSATLVLGAAAYAWVTHRLVGGSANQPSVTAAVQMPLPAVSHAAAALPLDTGSNTLDEPAPVTSGRAARASKPAAAATRDEVLLLQRARAAVARKDFAGALRPLAIHARKFKDGSLTEEREALRVKALAGLGRVDEARRCAAAFANAFPRSALLPVVQQIAPDDSRP